MSLTRAKPFSHLSTFTMEIPDEIVEDSFDEDIHLYIQRIARCSNRSQAISLRTSALKFIDRWRVQRLQQLDQHVRSAGQLILDAFDEYHSKRQQRAKCPHRSPQVFNDKFSTTASRTVNEGTNSTPMLPPPPSIRDVTNDHRYLQRTTQNVEISVDRLKPPLLSSRRISFNSIEFGRDFTFETLAYLSSTSKDMAMTICEDNTLIYSQNGNELIVVSLIDSKQVSTIQLEKNSSIHDLCYVDWLCKCLVITDERIYLFDYRTTQRELIESGIGYICGAIDNRQEIFYLVKQSTLYKYDRNCLASLQADQYPIADGYHPRRIELDRQTNDYLALLVFTKEEQNYILIYSTKSLSNGYLYKIMIDDHIERKWICSDGNEGWLVRGTYPGSCFDLNINGLGSVRVFDCNEIRNVVSMNEHQRFIIRTTTEIFVLIKSSFVQSFNK